MRTWSDSPFCPAVGPEEVPEGRVLDRENGESRIVYEIAGSKGWIAKMYKKPLSDTAAADLRKLVYLPTLMSQRDQTLVDASIAWPVARILDGPQVVGVVMAKAPDSFFVRLRKLSGTATDATPLLLDWLVMSGDACAKRGIQPADLSVRLRAMAELLAVGALFARYDIVYADWSYNNAFWEQGTGAAFVIDMDTCAFGTRKWIQSVGWEDPLFPEKKKQPLTIHSDRYKLAMLTVRCLTGVRQDPMEAYRALVDLIGSNPFTDTLEQALTASRATDRPGPTELVVAFRHTADQGFAAAPVHAAANVPVNATPGNVTGQIRVGAPSSPSLVDPAVRSVPNPGNVTGNVDLRNRVPKPATPQRTSAPEPASVSAPLPTPTSAPEPPVATTASPQPVQRQESSNHALVVVTGAVLLLIALFLAHFALGWV
ncbi:hypothetical protein ABIA33_004715 [Streptacidiphilus sp. MAP12-16]